MDSDKYNEFLRDKLLDLFGKTQCPMFMEASDKPRPTVIRVNSEKIRRKELLKFLEQRGMEVEPIEWTSEGVVVFTSPVPVGATPEYLCGLYTVQGASSMLPVLNMDLETAIRSIASKKSDKTKKLVQNNLTTSISVSYPQKTSGVRSSTEDTITSNNSGEKDKDCNGNENPQEDSYSNIRDFSVPKGLKELNGIEEKLEPDNHSSADLANDDTTGESLADENLKNRDLQSSTPSEENPTAEALIEEKLNILSPISTAQTKEASTSSEENPTEEALSEEKLNIPSPLSTAQNKEASTEDKVTAADPELTIHTENQISEERYEPLSKRSKNSSEVQTQHPSGTTEKAGLSKTVLNQTAPNNSNKKIKSKNLDNQDYKLKILDMCAAPGGKTTHIATIIGNHGTVYAYDINKDRCKAIQNNVSRLGLLNVVVVCQDSREMNLPKFFDSVLLDAPCSGTGVISKDPDVKTNRSYSDIERTVFLQKELILKAYNSLKVGGILVYSTCSVLVDENEAVVDYLVSKNIGAKVLETDTKIGLNGMARFRGSIFHPTLKNTKRIYPHVHNMDGFFLAKIIKTR